LRKQHDAFKTKVHDAVLEKNADLEKVEKGLETELAGVKNGAASTKTQLDERQRSINGLKGKQKYLQSEVKRLNEEHEHIRSKHMEERDNAIELEQWNDNCRAKIAALQREVAANDTKRKPMKRAMQILVMWLVRQRHLRRVSAAVRTKALDLQAKLDAKESELNMMQQWCVELESYISQGIKLVGRHDSLAATPAAAGMAGQRGIQRDTNEVDQAQSPITPISPEPPALGTRTLDPRLRRSMSEASAMPSRRTSSSTIPTHEHDVNPDNGAKGSASRGPKVYGLGYGPLPSS